MALLKKRHRGFVGWMKGHKRQTSLFLCLTVGLTWVDLIVPVFGETQKGEKKSGWTGRQGEGAPRRTRSALLFFLVFFFFGKNTFFCLSPFLLSNWCHVFNIICNVFQTLSCGGGGHLHSLDKHKDWQRGLNQEQMTNVKKNKTLTQQKTKRDS